MTFVRLLKWTGGFVVVAGLAAAGYATRDAWLPWVRSAPPADPPGTMAETAAPPGRVILSDQAQANLGLTAKPVKPETFWKALPVPGMVADRPGRSDRAVVTPASGLVVGIDRVPGDTVKPGELLFTLKLLSEPLHQTQTDLYKAAQDVKLARAQRERLAAPGGTVSPMRIVEVDDQIARLTVTVAAHREELRTRGLSPGQIDGVAEGRFVTEITVTAPRPAQPAPPPAVAASAGAALTAGPPAVELQELKVELGQLVSAGQTLCLLADHRALAIEGRAFRDEAPLLERAVQDGWPVEVDFQDPPGAGWPADGQTFHIERLATTVDPVNRTFAFWLPLENPSRTVERNGRTQTLWRFRPGQKVRLHVPVEKLDNVFVLPADAVARDGPEAFVFTQNVNTFERKPVRVLVQDRRHAVVANDGALVPGTFVVQSAAAQLDRMVKAASGSGVPKGYHIHADGSLHKNEDEGK